MKTSPFEPIPKENCLRVVKGSRRGPEYQLAPQTIFGMDPDEPMVPASMQPVMPMTDEERANWEYCAWDLHPGDVLVVHPSAIHGAAPVSPVTRAFFADSGASFVLFPPTLTRA